MDRVEVFWAKRGREGSQQIELGRSKFATAMYYWIYKIHWWGTKRLACGVVPFKIEKFVNNLSLGLVKFGHPEYFPSLYNERCELERLRSQFVAEDPSWTWGLRSKHHLPVYQSDRDSSLSRWLHHDSSRWMTTPQQPTPYYIYQCNEQWHILLYCVDICALSGRETDFAKKQRANVHKIILKNFNGNAYGVNI